MKNSYVFYRSFFDAIDQASDTEQLRLFRGITIYALNGIEPKLEGLLQAVWLTIKPQLDANYARYLNGCKGAEHGKKGGRPKNPKKPQKNPT
ncbi:MAG: hypothetical protein K2M11_01345 [Paramuribaculum sp.]|nr:hypothetical protein [Paramuribaculum sp.]